MTMILRSIMGSLAFSCTLLAPLSAPQSSQPTQALFPNSTDVGAAQPGTTKFDPSTKSYRVSGGGQDVWGTSDDFRFTWTKLSGDGSLAADVRVAQPISYRLSKGMLMFRESLDPGSPYADISIHADGHITLQYRLTQGGETKDTNLPEHGSLHLRIVRQGDRFTAYATSGTGETASPPSITIPMKNPVYVGVGVCSHNTGALQTVSFSNVSLERSNR